MKSAAFVTRCHAAIIEVWLSGNRGLLAALRPTRGVVTLTPDRARIVPAATR